jgi:hypothetical protein
MAGCICTSFFLFFNALKRMLHLFPKTKKKKKKEAEGKSSQGLWS